MRSVFVLFVAGSYSQQL